MRRYSLIVVAFVMALGALSTVGAGRGALANFFGPITGNDTGGIIPYTPELKGTYRELAAEYCARWDRLSHVTSVHPRYGDYVSFVCIDRPWMIH
jgi:hypothetical protein